MWIRGEECTFEEGGVCSGGGITNIKYICKGTEDSLTPRYTLITPRNPAYTPRKHILFYTNIPIFKSGKGTHRVPFPLLNIGRMIII